MNQWAAGHSIGRRRSRTRFAIILLLGVLVLVSLAVDVVGRVRPLHLVVWDSAESVGMINFAGGQVQWCTLDLGDVSGLPQPLVAAMRNEFGFFKAALREGSLTWWHPTGRYFYIFSTDRNLNPKYPGAGRSSAPGKGGPRKFNHYTVTGFPNWFLTVALLLWPAAAYAPGVALPELRV